MDTRRLARIAGRALVAPALLPLLAACAPSIPLSKQVKSSIRSVSINKDVAMPIGVAWAVGCLPRTECSGHGLLRQLTTDLGQVLRADFETQLTRARVFPSVLTEGGDAEFTLSLLAIRLQVATGMCGFLDHCFTPMVVVEGILRARDGPVLWQRREELNILARGVPKRALSTYNDRPELVRQDFAAAIHIAAERLVSDVAEQGP